MFCLPIFLEVAGSEQRFGIRAGFQPGEADNQRGCEAGEGLQCGQRERVERFEMRTKRRQRRGGLGSVEDADDAFELHAVDFTGQLEQRVPRRPLPRGERLVGFGAVTQRVALGVGEDAADGIGGIDGNDVDRKIGHVAKAEPGGVYLLGLRAPLIGQGLGERATEDDLRAGLRGLHPPSVECDLPAGVRWLDRDLAPKPLHGFGLRQRRAISRVTTNTSTKPIATRT